MEVRCFGGMELSLLAVYPSMVDLNWIFSSKRHQLRRCNYYISDDVTVLVVT
jgi:hypothetical protein